MEFLIAAALTCADVSRLVDRAQTERNLSDETRQEIVEMYQVHLTEAVGLECTWDAKAEWQKSLTVVSSMTPKSTIQKYSLKHLSIEIMI